MTNCNKTQHNCYKFARGGAVLEKETKENGIVKNEREISGAEQPDKKYK